MTNSAIRPTNQVTNRFLLTPHQDGEAPIRVGGKGNPTKVQLSTGYVEAVGDRLRFINPLLKWESVKVNGTGVGNYTFRVGDRLTFSNGTGYTIGETVN